MMGDSKSAGMIVSCKCADQRGRHSENREPAGYEMEAFSPPR